MLVFFVAMDIVEQNILAEHLMSPEEMNFLY